MPQSETNGTLDVTQAYKTVEARLTQAIAQQHTNTPESSPTPQEATVQQTATSETLQTPNPKPSKETPSATPKTAPACDQAAAAYPKIDITVNDDTEMTPGQEFTKVWRIVNVGTCTWTPDYQVVFFSGEQMDAPSKIPLGETVAPNQSVDIRVDMIAPNEPGTYQGNWKLQNTNGDLFGIGPHGESPFWVRIVVVNDNSPTPTATFTPAPTPEVLVNRTITLNAGDSVDLDTSILNNEDADIAYQVTEDETPLHQLAPIGATSFGIFRTEQPNFSSCQTTATSNTLLDIAQIPLGTYLCYKTGLSLPGWLRLDAFDAENNTITIEFTTWVIP